jgi:alpha-galactosidase
MGTTTLEWAAEVGYIGVRPRYPRNWDIPDARKVNAGGRCRINLDMQQGLEDYAGPGHWNDPDMLQVGNGDLTENENRAHFSLWSMLAAPLFSGNDIRLMNPSVGDVLMNTEVIAIDQDPLGKQGFKVKDYGQLELYYKPLKNGELAFCVFNRFQHPVKIELNWQKLSIAAWKGEEGIELPLNIDREEIKLEIRYQIRDLWKKEFLGDTDRPTVAEIAGHDVLMLKLIK